MMKSTRWVAFLLLCASATSAQTDRPEDILALRQLLVAHQFARLDSALSHRQLEASTTPTKESRYSYAYDAFDNADSTIGPHLDAWVASRTLSPYAHLARGSYELERAKAARGGKWASDTKPEQFEAMEGWLKLARADAVRATELDSTDAEAYGIVISIARLVGADDAGRRAINRAVAINPATLLRRIDYLITLRPRWSGEVADMDMFARTSQQFVDKNPRLRALLGFSAYDRAEGLADDQRYDRAIAAYTEALSYGDYWRYRLGRGETYSRVDEPEKALVDFNRVVLERPGSVEALAWRAITYSELADLAEGAAATALLRRGKEDLRLATLLDPNDATIKWVREDYPQLITAPGIPAVRKSR